MRNSFLIALFCLLLAGCDKDKFTTAPQLEFKSVSTEVLGPGNIISFTLGFTDNEGDVDSVFIRKITPRCPATIFRDDRSLPQDFRITNGREGELLISYGYRVTNYPSVGEPLCNFDDTCTFRFVIKDKAKNLSDTVYSDQVIILKR